jgi:Ca-activated chloride channel family protein
MIFLSPTYLRIGIVVAVLVVVGYVVHARRLRRLGDFLGGRRGAGRVSMRNLYRLRMEQIVLLGGAALALGASAAEPRFTGGDPAEQDDSVVSVVLGVDVSASMQSGDVSPTRLNQAVEAADEFLARASGARVGLLLFAAKGYVLAPPTEDLSALRALLSGVAPTTASAQDPGSLLSAGIRDAGVLLSQEALSDERMIVLISDGEAGEPDADVSAAVAAVTSEGVSVHTIGVGTRRGGEIRLPADAFREAGPVLDVTGSPAVSRLQDAVLRRVAREGGGRYLHADDAGALRRFAQSVRTRVGVAASSPTLPDGNLPFRFAVVGLILLVLHGLSELTSARLPGTKARERV